VPQRLGLLGELTLRENVEHPFRLARGGVGPDERAAVEELLEELAIVELADRPPARCSLGEQQRAAVARALVVGPRLLVADEPTAHLDAGSTRMAFDAIGRRVLRGMTLLVATHDPDVLAHVDRVVSMADGRIAPRA
jgi:putative ABC transport system ATP-binding protein